MEMVTITMGVAEARKFFGGMPELYNMAQIAEKYGLHPQFVREAIKNGRLKSRLVGKCLMSTPAEIADWLDVMARPMASYNQE